MSPVSLPTRAGAGAPPAIPAELRRDFAVIVPAYNEVENIPALFAAIAESFRRHGLGGEVILVDDGSTDGTYEAALHEAERFPRARVLRHRRNLGKTEAMVTAAAAAESGYIVLFDADLQHSPEEIPRFLAKLAEGWDIVTGRKVGALREARGLLGLQPALAAPLRGAGARPQLHEGVPPRDPGRDRPAPRLAPLLHRAGARAGLLGHRDRHRALPRHAGEAKYSGRRRILVGVGDLLVVWFYLKFSAKPMQFFGGSGLVLIGFGVLVGLVAIALRLGGWMPPFGYRPLLTLVLLLETVGFMLFGFGFIAELIATLRSEVDDLRRRLRQD